MINEEDHLRIQAFQTDCSCGPAGTDQRHRQSDRAEDRVRFSSGYGYLTACPTNLGTGIRVSVMLASAALKMAGQIEKFLQAARDADLTVRGLFVRRDRGGRRFYQLSTR